MFRRSKLHPDSLDSVFVTSGLGRRRTRSGCIMQIVGWLAGERKHTPRPETVASDLHTHFHALNDTASQNDRQKLKEIAPLLVNFHPAKRIMDAAAMKVSGVSEWTAMRLDSVDIWIAWVKAVREFESDSESFTDEDRRFLDDVSRGRITAAVAPSVLLVGSMLIALVF